MKILKYYTEYENDKEVLHIKKHNVSIEEMEEFFNHCVYFERKRKDKSFTAYGRLKSGRYLKVIFRKESQNIFFIITAYDLEDRQMINFLEDNYL